MNGEYQMLDAYGNSGPSVGTTLRMSLVYIMAGFMIMGHIMFYALWALNLMNMDIITAQRLISWDYYRLGINVFGIMGPCGTYFLMYHTKMGIFYWIQAGCVIFPILVHGISLASFVNDAISCDTHHYCYNTNAGSWPFDWAFVVNGGLILMMLFLNVAYLPLNIYIRTRMEMLNALAIAADNKAPTAQYMRNKIGSEIHTTAVHVSNSIGNDNTVGLDIPVPNIHQPPVIPIHGLNSTIKKQD